MTQICKRLEKIENKISEHENIKYSPKDDKIKEKNKRLEHEKDSLITICEKHRKKYDSLNSILKNQEKNYQTLNNQLNNSKSKFTTLIGENFQHKDYSRVEYFSVLPVKNYPDQFAIFLSVANSTDSRDIQIIVYEDDNLLFDETVKVTHKVSWFRQVFFNSKKTYKIHYSAFDRHDQTLVETKNIIVDKQYIQNQLPKNGYLTLQ